MFWRSGMVVDGLAVAAGPTIPLTTGQAFVFLGLSLLLVAAWAWSQRDVFASQSRERFERAGWTWLARRIPDRRWRRITVFFAVFWAALGIVLLLMGVVFVFMNM